jgi:hypothetical protein
VADPLKPFRRWFMAAFFYYLLAKDRFATGA